MKSALPKTANLILCNVFTAICLFQLFLIPLFFNNPVWMLAAALMLAPLNTPFWSLIHEAIHRNFHPSRWINELAGRAMSILFGASFAILRAGHLMHHQFNREWESEFYQEPEKTKWMAILGHYSKLLGGLYLTEVIISFAVAFAPLSITRKLCAALLEDDRQRMSISNLLLKKKHIRAIRLDCALIAALYAGSFLLFWPYWYVLVFMIGARALLISLMDNAYHYGTPIDNSTAAKELKVPAWMEKFMLNFNYHLTHHQNTQIPWTGLARQHKVMNNRFAGHLGRSILAQFQGPLKIESSNPD